MNSSVSEDSSGEASEAEEDTGAPFAGGGYTLQEKAAETPDMAVFPTVGDTEDNVMNAAAAVFTDISTEASAVSEASGGADITAGVDLDEAILDAGVAGERMAPIVEAVENGTFTRSMMFTEEGTKAAPFMWWLVMVLLGAKGVQMYVKSRRKEKKTVRN